jgi:hypothetical protein
MKTYLRLFILLFITTTLVLYEPNPEVFAASFMDKFIDPKDGKFDLSDWLLKQKGFLPIVDIITEPAVGYGLGFGLLFFHESFGQKIEEAQFESEEEKIDGKYKKLAPPSISGIFGAKTENGTWAAGGGHFGSWKNDKIRYLGGVGLMSVNLTFYGKSEDSILKDGVDYNLEGWGILQELLFRMADSDVFLGAKLTYFDTESTFDLSNIPIEVEQWEVNFRNVGLGVVVEYDSRDNIFAPNHGVNLDISAMFYNGEGVLDDNTREYQITQAINRWYYPVLSNLIMGWRVQADLSSGLVPFYALPSIDLRGIPYNRYQGNHVLETELEARYQFTDRWGVIPFVGVGATANELNEFGSGTPRWAGGVGIRYTIARKMRLTYGLDIARGPEDWAIYFQVGSGL